MNKVMKVRKKWSVPTIIALAFAIIGVLILALLFAQWGLLYFLNDYDGGEAIVLITIVATIIVVPLIIYYFILFFIFRNFDAKDKTINAFLSNALLLVPAFCVIVWVVSW